MKIRKIAAITILVISSFAASGVAPSKAELEAMYDKAFREFDANNYEQALKDLDAIDARQPDLAESQNLRGVILMREKDYANAEKALRKALAADPKFWNARFNLAEIPFLEKKWPEARKRFQELLSGNASELQAEATQLIQYKVLITYLMEGKDDMVSAMLAKFELSPDTPAVQYANAAIALHKKKDKEARDALTAAEKNFSPQLNKLFAESLYEVGWLEKPAGQSRAALELNSQAERAAQTKAFAKARFDEAEQALAQRDLTAAKKLIEEADAADPNQAAVINLRGEILLQQKEFEQAENEFRKAATVDPNYRDAQYNLAQVPFKQKDYAKARDRFEALFASTSGEDKDRAAQLIKFKIYLTLLLEGKDSRAQKMMEQFQFTGDTPALYYAQAAWEFKHDNATKANDWVNSARKIYPLALNGVFADAFFDLGWLQVPAPETTTAVAAADGAQQPDVPPSIEPTPIPSMTLAQVAPPQGADSLSLATQTNPPISGMEATTSDASGSATASSALVAAASPSVETPVASTAAPAASQPVVANASEAEPAKAPPVSAAAVSASPATVLAPAKVREWSEPTWTERFEQMGVRNIGLVSLLILAVILLFSWVMIPIFRRRLAHNTGEVETPLVETSAFQAGESVGAVEQFGSSVQVAGGPPQVSLHLRASEPSLRRAVMPLGKSAIAVGRGPEAEPQATAPAPFETFDAPEPMAEPAAAAFDEGVGEPVVSFAADEGTAVAEETVGAFDEPPVEAVVDEPVAAFFEDAQAVATDEPIQFDSNFVEAPSVLETEADFAELEADLDEPSLSEIEELSPVSEEIVAAEEEIAEQVFAQTEEEPIVLSVEEAFGGEIGFEAMPVDEVPVEEIPVMEIEAETPVDEELAVASSSVEIGDFEPVGQGQPIPYLTPAPASEVSQPEPETSWEEPAAAAALGAGLAGIGALGHSVAPSPDFEDVSNEPMAQQSTTPANMPQPTPTTPVIRPASSSPTPTGGAQSSGQPAAGGMHTAVQLTISFEIASMQLTSSFKMGALQLKPTSKIVTMRLAPSQNPAPAMNLQVTFEIASVQLAGNAIGTIRLTPSQQQRPSISSSPSFSVAGLQLVSGSESAPVQITPAQQGQASVHVTAGFQIATVEFSPSFEISSIILNSNSRNVSVQLPGSGPSAVEGAPVFEVTSVQLGSNGEISTMSLNPPGAKRA